jgi:hypothetical protein
VYVYNLILPQVKRVLRGHTGAVSELQFSEDGGYLLTSSTRDLSPFALMTMMTALTLIRSSFVWSLGEGKIVMDCQPHNGDIL